MANSGGGAGAAVCVPSVKLYRADSNNLSLVRSMHTAASRKPVHPHFIALRVIARELHVERERFACAASAPRSIDWLKSLKDR